MILRKNEDNENEYLSSLKQGFDLIPEDDESIIEDDLSDALGNEESKTPPTPVPVPQVTNEPR